MPELELETAKDDYYGRLSSQLQEFYEEERRFLPRPGINNGQQINIPKNNNNSRPNIQERHHHTQNQHQQSLQMLSQNFLNHPKNAIQKGAKKREPSRPRIIRVGDWLC
jgi:hypothetical protein